MEGRYKTHQPKETKTLYQVLSVRQSIHINRKLGRASSLLEHRIGVRQALKRQ